MGKKNNVKNLRVEKELIIRKSRTKKLSKVLIITFLIFILLIVRLSWIQFVEGRFVKRTSL